MHKALASAAALVRVDQNWPGRVAVDTQMYCEEPGIGAWEGIRGNPQTQEIRLRGNWERGGVYVLCSLLH